MMGYDSPDYCNYGSSGLSVACDKKKKNQPHPAAKIFENFFFSNFLENLR